MAGYIRDAVVLGAIYTLFAMGLTLVWGVLNILNLAYGQIFALGAVGAWVLTKDSSLPLFVVLPLAMLVCGAAAILLELVAFRPIRRRVPDATGAELAMVIASIGAGAALVVVLQQITDGDVKTLPEDVFAVKSLKLFGVQITNLEIVIVVISTLFAIGLALFVAKTKQGRALKALAHDRYTCSLLGISANRMAMITMFTSGALAGAAGVL